MPASSEAKVRKRARDALSAGRPFHAHGEENQRIADEVRASVRMPRMNAMMVFLRDLNAAPLGNNHGSRVSCDFPAWTIKAGRDFDGNAFHFMDAFHGKRYSVIVALEHSELLRGTKFPA